MSIIEGRNMLNIKVVCWTLYMLRLTIRTSDKELFEQRIRKTKPFAETFETGTLARLLVVVA